MAPGRDEPLISAQQPRNQMGRRVQQSLPLVVAVKKRKVVKTVEVRMRMDVWDEVVLSPFDDEAVVVRLYQL